MISSIHFVTLDTCGARIPFFSTAMSFAHLFLKHAVMPCMNEHSIKENHFLTHLSHSNSWRQVALLFPIIGNIAVWIYDKLTEPTPNPAAQQQEEALKRLIEANDASAMIALAMIHTTGKPAEEDFTNAIAYAKKLLKQAVTFGHADAELLLGVLYIKFHYDHSEVYEAVKIFQEAVKKNDFIGFYGLGLCHLWILNPETSPALAVENLRKAVEMRALAPPNPLFDDIDNQFGQSLYLLGLCYHDGRNGFKVDTKKALELFTQAVQCGFTQVSRHGTIQDRKNALAIFKEAIQLGCTDEKENALELLKQVIQYCKESKSEQAEINELSLKLFGIDLTKAKAA